MNITRRPHLISLCLNAQDVLFKQIFIVNARKVLEKGELVWLQVIIAGIKLGAQNGVGIYRSSHHDDQISMHEIEIR